MEFEVCGTSRNSRLPLRDRVQTGHASDDDAAVRPRRDGGCLASFASHGAYVEDVPARSHLGDAEANRKVVVGDE